MSKSPVEIKADLYELPKNTRAQIAMEELMDCVNVMGGEEEVGEIMATVLQNTHRTLQQSFFTALQAMVEQYKDTPTDLRNQEAVAFAKEIAELEHHLPFI